MRFATALTFATTRPLDPVWLASAVAFAVSMSATPGPNNAMLAASGSAWGFRRTLPHMLGISVGFPVMLVVVALGAGTPLRRHPEVLDVLRWLGAAYLLWLAFKIGTARPRPPAEADASELSGSRGRPLSFLQAAVFQWINPKAWVIVLSALATLTTLAGEPSRVRALLLACAFLTTNFPITALWTSIGVGVGRVLRTPRRLRRFNVLMALLLSASLIPMLLGPG
jgi:threonine/homoserine/homoserine lactone efflux protein